jgi:hypothetical protein
MGCDIHRKKVGLGGGKSLQVVDLNVLSLSRAPVERAIMSAPDRRNVSNNRISGKAPRCRKYSIIEYCTTV